MSPAPFQRVAAVNVGLGSFGDAVRAQGAEAVDVDWRPPAGGGPGALRRLEALWGGQGDRVERANAAAVERIEDARPRAVTVARARDVMPVLDDGVLLHAGPPIAWDAVCDPQRRALLAACVLEGWAGDRAAAERLLAEGQVRLESGNEHGHVGPMTGVCSPSTAVWVVEDDDGGVRAFASLNEGSGATMWITGGGGAAVERRRFLSDRARPVLAALLDRTGPIDVFALAAQGLQMGDELHMRSQATGALLVKRLAGGFAALGGERVARFVAGNHHFFLTLTMAAAKCASTAAEGVDGSTIV